MKITRLETQLVKPRSLFLKVHTDEGLVGLGEPILEGRAQTCAAAVAELEPYLVGQDPTRVVHHWQAMYRHAFYRGGPILTSALSGVEQALWDLAGKAAGLPVYRMLGGPVRDRIRVYAHAGGGTPAEAAANARNRVAQGFTMLKCGVAGTRTGRVVDSPAAIDHAVETFAAMREAVGRGVDIGIDFHGAISPQTAAILIHELEPYQPMFVEEPVQCQNVAALADLARKTHIPIATGERLMTKWAFREVLEQGAASILQPDISHAGGIFECRLIAGMAEAYYAALAPHCPLGAISLAACVQLDATIPNFLGQEQVLVGAMLEPRAQGDVYGGTAAAAAGGDEQPVVLLGEGYLTRPFVVRGGYLELPDGPGLGIELDEEALAPRITDEGWRSPETYDPYDGSVVDW